ncbi:hypothetical protein RFI_27977 [Reticulomyxa filosa]|uniref:RGS domain-containing protein n=1 Tax=Reticulomyxa filosa TaxID=46433 RepID=X6M7I8_RETFI|nr:hypothetical protein RFI_27977 [Reticulomyxa filosa]|eukprot:ETO09402.1 hypothetical protein RFI_27977 [Reticulomyxa filosa]
MLENAAIYFTVMRYIHIDEKNQERWLSFHLEYLKAPKLANIPRYVLIAHLHSILNVARQMDFVGKKTNEVKVLNEIFEIARRLATSGKGRPVKRACYMLMLALILRGPDSMYEKLQSFLESHVLNHLDELEKVGDSLDMLIMLFEGTNNPFPFHEKRPINWLTNVRSDDDENTRKNHMQVVFKAFMRGKALKIMSQRHWFRCVRLFVHLCAQHLEFATSTLLPQLFDVKKSTVEQIVLGLDVISEIMRLDGEFLRQHQSNPALLPVINDFLPAMLEHADQAIGVDKIGRRTQPLILSDRSSDSFVTNQINIAETAPDTPVDWQSQQQSQQQLSSSSPPADSDGTGNTRVSIVASNTFQTHHLNKSQNEDDHNNNNVWWNRGDDDDEKKTAVDELAEEKKQEDTIINDPTYVSLQNKDLLKISFVQNNKMAKYILNLRQKHADANTLDEMIKKAKATNRREYLQVLKACLRATLALHPPSVLTDAKQGNKLYVGNLLLHPDYETTELAVSVLTEVAKQEKILLPKILIALTNFTLQFYIHESACLSILLQTLTKLVMVFVEYPPLKRIQIVSQKQTIEDLCVAVHRLDAVAFAFLCHTNIYIRHACVELIQTVQKAMQHLVAYYFADKPPAQQQIQLSFPFSLGQLFEFYSDEIVHRALIKFKNHQDNIKLTISDFETNFMEKYHKNIEYDPTHGVLRTLLDPNDFAPYSACMDVIVEQIELLCAQGSEYMKFLRVDCCQEILLQEKWLAVDEKSAEREVLGSMCIALIPLIGYSDNGLDEIEFYNSIWVQLWRFSRENDSQLLNTILYAVQCAHPSRLSQLLKSLRLWYTTNLQQPKGRIKKSKITQIFFANCRRVWVYNYVILALTTKERLCQVFRQELQSYLDNKQDNDNRKVEYLHVALIDFCNSLDDKHLIQHCNGDPEVFRCVARIVENIAYALYTVGEELKIKWLHELWNPERRAHILRIMKLWSHCSTDNGSEGKELIAAIFSKRKALRDKNADQAQERQLRLRILQLEYQAFRAATAVLALGPALPKEDILPKEDSKELSWFQWAVEGQKGGIPSLKYLMRNYYALILNSVLAMLYSELARGGYDLPEQINGGGGDNGDDEKSNELNSTDITKQLVVFCLLYLIPFVDKEVLMGGKTIAQHRRDTSSLVTFRGVPTDNYGATYALSLPVNLSTKDIQQAVSYAEEEGSQHIVRPRLLSPVLISRGMAAQSRENTSSIGTGGYNRADAMTAVRVADDIMHAINMSRRSFALFYKLAKKICRSDESLDRLFELRMGLQSLDIRDVRHNAMQISVIFANASATEMSHDIVDEILTTLERMTARMHQFEQQGILTSTLQDNHLTLTSNLLQIALPWFANAPLHSCNDSEKYMERLLNLTLKFGHEGKPEIDTQFHRVWHAVLTSNTTLMSHPEPKNIDTAIRFLIRTVIGRYEGYRQDLKDIDGYELQAKQALQDEMEMQNRNKSKSIFGGKNKSSKEFDTTNASQNLQKVDEMRRAVLTPEQFIVMCENILRQVFVTHPESVLCSLLQIINVGCGLGGHVLPNADHIQITQDNDGYTDSSLQLGGEPYAHLVTEIVIRWLTSLVTRNMQRLRCTLPVIMTHSLLFLSKPMEQFANPNSELLSHLFVSLLPPRIGIDDEVVQLAMWLRDRRTYQFQWSEHPITDFEPWTTDLITTEVESCFVEGGARLNLQKWFARKTTIYIDDFARLLYACFKVRYGTKEAINAWGMRCLQWATVEVDPTEHGTVFKARQMASRALRLYCIIGEPLTLKVVSLVLQTIIRGLKTSQKFWSTYPPEQRYSRADNDILLAIRGIETLTVIVQTKKEWSKSLFRVILVIFWIALSLLQCRVATVQVASRKLLHHIMTHKKWITWLFQHSKTSDGTRVRKDSASLTLFWDLYKLFQPNFQGIQERLISALIYSVGESSPVPLSVDQIKKFKKRDDVMPISSEENNNAELLQITEDDDDDDELDTVDPIERAEVLRKRAETGRRLRERNARLFTLLALYMQQNILEDKNGENINLQEIDFDNQDHLLKYPLPNWSKIDQNFRATYVAIYDVMMHIATTLKACLTSEEPSTHRALGDFCQALIDLFIPTQAATLARVFAVCLDVGDDLQLLGCIQALRLFVPRLLKQCKQLNVFQEVIACFDDTFARCVALTSSDNDAVAQAAHEFVLLLTKNEYKITQHKSRVMQNNMYPAFKREADIFEDGMTSTLTNLSQIFDKANQINAKYPDEIKIDSKLNRLLMMEPKDVRMEPSSPHGGISKSQRSFSSAQKSPQQSPLVQREPSKDQMLKPALHQMQESSLSDLDGMDSDRNLKIMVSEGNLLANGNNAKKSSMKLKQSQKKIEMEKKEEIDEKQYQTEVMRKIAGVGGNSNVDGTHSRVHTLGGAQLQKMQQEHNIEYVDEDSEKRDDEEEEQDEEEHEQQEEQQSNKDKDNNLDQSYTQGPMIKIASYKQQDMLEQGGIMPSANRQLRQQALDETPPVIKPRPSKSVRELEKEKEKLKENDEILLRKNTENRSNSDAKRPSKPASPKVVVELVSSNDNNVDNEMDIEIPPADLTERNSAARPAYVETGGDQGEDAVPQGVLMNTDGSVANLKASDKPMPSSTSKTNIPQNIKSEPVESHDNDQNIPVGDLSTFLEDTTLLRILLKHLKKLFKIVFDFAFFIFICLLCYMSRKTADYKLLEFYLMANQFKTFTQDPTCNPKTQRDNAKLIIETFFLVTFCYYLFWQFLYPKFLETIQGTTRHDAMKVFVQTKKNDMLPADLLDKAKQEVKSDMISRVFPDFMTSERYKRLVEEGTIRMP